MKIRFEKDFLLALNEQVEYIAKDKPKAARKFKSDLVKNLRKDLKRPFHFKNPYILIMKLSEITFSKAMFVFISLTQKTK